MAGYAFGSNPPYELQATFPAAELPAPYSAISTAACTAGPASGRSSIAIMQTAAQASRAVAAAKT